MCGLGPYPQICKPCFTWRHSCQVKVNQGQGPAPCPHLQLLKGAVWGQNPDPKYCLLSEISYGKMGAGTGQRSWSGCGLYRWAMDSRSMGKTHNKKIEPL